MEFVVFFTIANCERRYFCILFLDISKFFHDFCLSETHFHKTGPLKLSKTMLKYFHV